MGADRSRVGVSLTARFLGSDLRTRGFSTFNEILNVVAPPISEHEVIQVWSSHDMEGYEGVESLVYKALARASTHS